jgi:hypothetical protein
MGSVAEGVMRKAPCPVLIVKQPDHIEDSHNDSLTADTESRDSE